MKLTPTLAIAAALAFVGVLAAYVVLTITGHGAETGALVTAVVTLLGFVGVGAHNEARTQQQNVALAQITRQTNGVLDDRIRSGAEAAIRSVMSETVTPATELPADVPPVPTSEAGGL